MEKRGALCSAVKKAFSCNSKEKREKKNPTPGKWTGNQRSMDLASSSTENAVVVPASRSPMDGVKLMQAENEQNRHAYSVALATAMAAEAAVAAAHAAAEVARLTAAARNLGKTKEEIAALKIQTAFRGYLARRSLRALRGLVRLKSMIAGLSVKRQSATTLKYMQTLARVQSEIHARRIRISEENMATQRQIQQKREIEKLRASIGENWSDSRQSKEQMEAKLQNRQEASVRRERALAYAYSHQQTRRNSSNFANQTFMDPRNPHWSWSWLERWMGARPWENGSAIDKEPNGDHVSVQSTPSNSISAQGDTKMQSSTAQKQSRPPGRQSPSTPNSNVAGKLRPPGPSSTNSTDDVSRSMNSIQSDRCRRHSISVSSVRDDDSSASSPAGVRRYMASTVSAKAKSRFSSPPIVGKVRTPEKLSGFSTKKRLSFSDSPAGPGRHSAPPKIGISPNKETTANS